jgi:hypothetical protein
MTMKSPADAHATEADRTELLRPVARVTETQHLTDATEKLSVVTPATEKLSPVSPAADATEKLVAVIPAQRLNSRPGHPQPAAVAPAPIAALPSRWEHLPTEHHPAEPAVRPPAESAVPQPAVRQPALRRPERAARPAPRPPHAPRQLWQRSAVLLKPAQGPFAAAGFAACDYLIRTVSILGLLAVVGMVSAGTAQTQAPERTPGTTVATAPAHPGAFTSTRHH